MRALKFRLYPSAGQADVLRTWADASRFSYNIALEQRRDYWRQYRAATGQWLNAAAQSREMTALRAECDWLAKVPRSICEQSLRDLERAFAAFFRGSGYPRFRTKDKHVSFRIQGREARVFSLNAKWGILCLPHGQRIKFRRTRETPDVFDAVTVRCTGEAWYVTMSCREDPAPEYSAKSAVGIDRGIANTLALSNGDLRQLPDYVHRTVAARRRSQRVLCRRKMGSKRRQLAKKQMARLSRQASAARLHWLHEATTEIATNFSDVSIERLSVHNMTTGGRSFKKGINRSILEQGWGIFAELLEYKLIARGGRLHRVNASYTSQTCSVCGCVKSESRKSQAVFQCVDCGHAAHADVNAAINILRRSPAGVEGVGCDPVEALTGRMPKHLENLAA